MATPQMMALDQALAEVEVPQPDPGRWAGQLADVAGQMRTVIGRHRDIVPCPIGFLPGGGRALRCHERVLAILRAGGLSDSRAVAGLYLLWLVVNGFSLEETGAGEPERTDPELSPVVRQYFASLPGDRFPNLVAAGEFATTTFDDRFELLIGIIIDGLAGCPVSVKPAPADLTRPVTARRPVIGLINPQARTAAGRRGRAGGYAYFVTSATVKPCAWMCL